MYLNSLASESEKMIDCTKPLEIMLLPVQQRLQTHQERANDVHETFDTDHTDGPWSEKKTTPVWYRKGKPSLGMMIRGERREMEL